MLTRQNLMMKDKLVYAALILMHALDEYVKPHI